MSPGEGGAGVGEVDDFEAAGAEGFVEGVCSDRQVSVDGGAVGVDEDGDQRLRRRA